MDAATVVLGDRAVIVAGSGPLILRGRLRGRIIDLLRKSHPGAWRYLPHEHVWRRGDGREVRPKAHWAPRYEGDDDNYIARYYWTDTDEEVVF
jgi:hypothetical protein